MIAVLGVLLATAFFAVKYVVIDLLDSETELMTRFRQPRAETRSRIESERLLPELANICIDVYADLEASGTDAGEKRDYLVTLLTRRDLQAPISMLSSAAQDLSELDACYSRARSAGDWKWLVGAIGLICIALACISLLTDHLQAALGLILGGYGLTIWALTFRFRYDLSKRRLGRFINDH